MAAKRARFEQLAMPAVNALYRQAMRLTNDPDDAQDLVQDTFERGFKAFDSFQPGSNFEAWMTTIERNAYFNQYAKAKRRPQRANDSTGEYDDWDIYDAAEHTSDGLKSAEEEYLDAFAPEEIMAALAKLSPERRQVFIDAAIDGKSYQQVKEDAAKFAMTYKDDKVWNVMSSGAAWEVSYSDAFCFFQEMQTVHCVPVHSGEYFHGAFETCSKDLAILLFKSVGRTRALDERAERFLSKFAGHHWIIDAEKLGLGELDSSVAEYFNALLLHPISKQFIAAMGDVRMHPMSYRRYMWKFDY